MNNNFLIVLVAQPLNKFNYQKWCIGKKFKGWDIKFWNLLNIENKNLNKKFSSTGHRIIKNRNFININNYYHLYKEIVKLPGNFFYINLSVLKFRSSLIEKFLNLKGGKCVHFKMNMIPEPKITKKLSIEYFLKSPSKFFFLNKIFDYSLISMLNFIQKKILLGKPKIYFAPNIKAYKKYKKIKKAKIVLAHSYDYELYSRNISSKKKINNYIVFIDDDIDGHFEFSLMRGNKFFMSSNDYWSKVDKFLSFIELKFGKKVIIAGHHRRDKRKIPIKRKFIFDKTIDLVKNSKLVIMRDSTTIHQAILYKKPIILLKINEHERGGTVNAAIALLSKLTGAKIVNLESSDYKSKNFKLKELYKINNSKYEKYENYYIKPKLSPNRPIWNTVLNELRKLN